MAVRLRNLDVRQTQQTDTDDKLAMPSQPAHMCGVNGACWPWENDDRCCMRAPERTEAAAAAGPSAEPHR